MSDSQKFEYCGRPIIKELTARDKEIRGKSYRFCSEFCFRLFVYDVPTITVEDLHEKMYKPRCVDIDSPDFKTLVVEED